MKRLLPLLLILPLVRRIVAALVEPAR